MIKGLGNDIIENKRIAKAIQRHGSRFLKRVFTPQEQAYCSKHRDPDRHYAGRFAAKEAVVKALGIGITGKTTWLDIEVLNDVNGKPLVNLSESVQKLFNHPLIHLTISHCRDYTTAVAVWSEE